MRFKKGLILQAVLFVFLASIIILAGGCGGGSSGGGTTEKLDWTFLVYISADNSLEQQDEDYLDVKEMERVGSTDRVNVVIQWDKGGKGQYVDWSGCRRYKVLKDSEGQEAIVSTLLVDMGDVNMGIPETLENFIVWGIQNYPADRYAVILWNHGSGWRNPRSQNLILRDVCEDDSSGDMLTQAEVRQAFADAKSTTSVTVEMIGYDACLMGMLEVAYDLKDYGNFMAFSEASEPGGGWPYDKVLGDLAANPKMNGGILATSVVDRYSASYTNPSITMSAIDLSKMDGIRTATNDFVQVACDKMSAEGNNMRTAAGAALFFEPTYNDYRDMGDFTRRLMDLSSDAELNAAADELQKAEKAAVIKSFAGASVADATGLSIWLPDLTQYNQYLTKYSTLKFDQDTTWKNFLEDLVNI